MTPQKSNASHIPARRGGGARWIIRLPANAEQWFREHLFSQLLISSLPSIENHVQF
jgi:hypothetical protein